MSAMKNELIRRIDSPDSPEDWLLRASVAIEEAEDLLDREYEREIAVIWTKLLHLRQAIEINNRHPGCRGLTPT